MRNTCKIWQIASFCTVLITALLLLLLYLYEYVVNLITRLLTSCSIVNMLFELMAGYNRPLCLRLNYLRTTLFMNYFYAMAILELCFTQVRHADVGVCGPL